MDFIRLVKEERERARRLPQESLVVESALEAPSPSPTLIIHPEASVVGSVTLRLEHLSELFPNQLYYAEEVIDEDTSVRIECALECSKSAFTQLSSRRVAVFGQHPAHIDPGTAQPSSTSKELPTWLSCIAQSLVDAGLFAPERIPNNVLVNAYESTGGILHHTDGPAYFPGVAVLSLGGPVKITFRPRLRPEDIGGPRDVGDVVAVLLRPRSLLVFRNEFYSDHLHGIAEGVEAEIIDDLVCNAHMHMAGLAAGACVAREPRTSLTFRRIAE